MPHLRHLLSINTFNIINNVFDLPLFYTYQIIYHMIKYAYICIIYIYIYIYIYTNHGFLNHNILLI